jgi:GPH family glycoside/pentoside/hexuronide:cation symporter
MSRFSEKVGYGFGDMASSMFWKIFSYYLPFFYSNIFGLALTDAALLLLVTKIYDAVTDPLMGIVADRTRTRWGRYRPWLLWVALPFAVIGVLTFTTPAWSYGWKLVWTYGTYLLMMTAYTAINVPYGAMLGVVTDDSREKTVFSSYRMFFAYAGSFLAIVLFEPLVKLLGGVGAGEGLEAAGTGGWQLAMVVIGGIVMVMFWLCFAMTREHVKPADNHEKGSVGRDLKNLVGNGPWWYLLGAAIGVLIFNSIRGGAAAYFFKDFVGGASLFSNVIFTAGLFLAVGEIANMLGVVLAVPLSKRFGKKNAYIGSMVVAAVLSVLFFFIPATAIGYWTMLALQVAISVAAGVVLPLLWSMYADVADYSELQNGRASTGLIFSSSSMAQKFGGALGSALILWLLASFGYDTGAEAVQSEGATLGVRLLMSWIPAVGCLIAAGAMMLFPLGEKRMATIEAQLAKKREDDASR